MSKIITIGIDPGPQYSGYCVLRGVVPIEAGKIPSVQLANRIEKFQPGAIVCESFVGYQRLDSNGQMAAEMPGYFRRQAEIMDVPFFKYSRSKYWGHFCMGTKGSGSKDAALNAALQERFGDFKKGSPYFCLRGDTDRRAAFAVAIYHIDTFREIQP